MLVKVTSTVLVPAAVLVLVLLVMMVFAELTACAMHPSHGQAAGGEAHYFCQVSTVAALVAIAA